MCVGGWVTLVPQELLPGRALLTKPSSLLCGFSESEVVSLCQANLKCCFLFFGKGRGDQM